MAGMIKKEVTGKRDKIVISNADLEKKRRNRYFMFFFTILIVAAAFALLNPGYFSRQAGEGIGQDQLITGQAIIGEQKAQDQAAESSVAKSVVQKEIASIAEPKSGIVPRFVQYFDLGESKVTSIEIVDMNKDNYPDLIIGNLDTRAKLYLNNRKNGFGEAYEFKIVKVYDIAAADFNNDGSIDASLGVGRDRNYIFWNENDNTFPNINRITLTEIPSANSITGLAAFDFDHDGFQDLAASRDDNEGNTLYMNQGNEKFIESKQFGSKRAQDLIVADFDNDGWEDVLTANYNDDSKIYFNRGTKKAKLFDEYPVANKSGSFLRSAAVCDVDNDGWKDIAAANYAQQDLIFKNKKDRTFQTIAFSNQIKNSVDIACADFNNDGWNDLIVINYNEDSHLYLNNKTNFVRTTLKIPGNIDMIEPADFNKDGYIDLIVSRQDKNTDVWLNSLGNI